jgi:dipeptidyl aminopeptidase/acylaminoacyl peptidase
LASASGWVFTEVKELPATIDEAGWSHDGHAIYFHAQAENDTPPGYLDLYDFDVQSKTIRNLTRDFTGSVEHESPIGLAGGGVLEAVSEGVRTSAIEIAGAKPVTLEFATPLAGSFSTNDKQSAWVFLGAGSTQSRTLYYTTALNHPARQVAIPNLLPEHAHAVESKVTHWQSEQFTIEGLLYLPPQAANAKVPLIVDVHGGPTGAWQDGYDPFVNFLVGQGWAVFRPNVRGSTNYGATFVASNKNDLGGGDYRDLMAGVDYVLKNFPIDPDRLGMYGYSYGGEMAGFVEGKTGRFKAIVSGAPVIDQYSEYGTEDGSWYDRWFFGKPWEQVPDAWRQSPLAGATHAKTPFLLLQGEDDKTDPLGQSQEMYRALRQAGVPVELVTYPREDHGPLARGIVGQPVPEPWHGFDARKRIVEFFQKGFAKPAEK